MALYVRVLHVEWRQIPEQAHTSLPSTCDTPDIALQVKISHGVQLKQPALQVSGAQRNAENYHGSHWKGQKA